MRATLNHTVSQTTSKNRLKFKIHPMMQRQFLGKDSDLYSSTGGRVGDFRIFFVVKHLVIVGIESIIIAECLTFQKISLVLFAAHFIEEGIKLTPVIDGLNSGRFELLPHEDRFIKHQVYHLRDFQGDTEFRRSRRSPAIRRAS